MTQAATLLILAETIGEFLPNQYKPERYTVPVIKAMTTEWKKVKRRMADAIVAAAVKVAIPTEAEGVYDSEDSLSLGLLVQSQKKIVLSVVKSEALVSSLGHRGTTQIALNEAPKPKPGKLGIGRVRNATGKLEDVFFDELDEVALADISDNWKDTHYKAHFENYVSGGRPKSNGLVLKDSKGKVHGAALYRKFEDGSVEISHLETANFNRGKKGLSGTGSNLLARAGLEANDDSFLFLTSEKESLDFYEKIGMDRQGPKMEGVTYEMDRVTAQAFADKMGVSTSAVRKAIPIDATKEVTFTTASRSGMMKEVTTLMKDYKVFTGSLIADALKKAKGDTIPQLVKTGTGRGGFTTVKLNKEGMTQVVNSLKFQKDFVDDLTKSVVQRVEALTKGRYASSYDLRRDINRKFRIDRDKSISRFHSDVDKHAQSVMAGSMTPDQFKANMKKDIEKNYRSLYKEGKGGGSLKKWETDFIRKQADSQEQYLNNFAGYIQQQKDMGKKLTDRVSQRAHLYAERGTSMFEAGHLASLPDDVLVDWKMQPAEHCPTCPIYQSGSPYTKETLPGLPGEGFNVTICGTNCQCIIQVSDLYVTDTPDVNKELAIKVTTPKPPPVSGAKRISVDVVEFEGVTYKRTKLPAGYSYNVVNNSTGKVAPAIGLPKDVRTAFKKSNWPPAVPKTVVAPQPKTQKLIQTVSKPKGRPIPLEVQQGILTKDEVKKIDIAAKRAADPDFTAVKRSGIRDNVLVDELGLSRQNGKEYDKLLSMWADSSSKGGAMKLSVLNNKAEGLADTFGLSSSAKISLESSKYIPSKEDVKYFTAARRFNRETVRRLQGNTIEVHRGVVGKYADDAFQATRETGNSTVRIPTRALFSESTDVSIPVQFASAGGERGAVLTRKMKVREELVDSHWTNDRLSFMAEDEVISTVSGGFVNVKVEDVASIAGEF